MKEFRKTKEGLFICEECEKIIKTKCALSFHISKYHNNIKKYYDKYLKEKNEGICKTCGNQTRFLKLKGYRNFCSKKCVNNNEEILNKIKNTKINKYGNFNNIEKRYETNLKKYGVKDGFQSKKIKEKIKKTLLKKYGVENSYLIDNIRKKALILAHSKQANEKRKNTMIQRWGYENCMKSSIIKEKIKQTNLKRYGVEYNHQCPEILEKSLKSSFKIKYFRDTSIYYQGSYELDFLEKYYNKYPDITRGPTIKYIFDGEEHYYFPDFLILSKNLVVEVKSSYYYYKFFEQNKAKEHAVKDLKFNYKLFLDKKGEI